MTTASTSSPLAPAIATTWGPLRCPACTLTPVPLRAEGDALTGDCGHRFPIVDGIARLLDAGAAAESRAADAPTRDLTVVIPALNEAENLAVLLPQLREVLDELGLAYEVIIVTGREVDAATAAVVAQHAPAVRAIRQSDRGYGNAVRAGFAAAGSRFVVTMDADLSHRPDFLRPMWARRDNADMIIASRYVRGGSAEMPFSRVILSRVLNIFFRRGLRVKVRDMSSGYRLIRKDALSDIHLRGTDFDLVQEILVKAYCAGWRVAEVPFHYKPRKHGRSHAALVRFGIAYLKTFRSLWKVRNDVGAADYEDIAFDSSIPVQRYWQRSRRRRVLALIKGRGPVLNVGAGSSRLSASLPAGSVALDRSMEKLRYAARFGVARVLGSAEALPYPDASFSTVICASVIEHLPKASPVLAELVRVTAPGGLIVITTPNSRAFAWRLFRGLRARIVQGGADAREVAAYSRPELTGLLRSRGCTLTAARSILGAEMVLAFRKA